MKNNPIIIRHLGVKAYQPIWQAMRDFTEQRTAESPDEIWLLEHEPVFTQGLNGKPEHILDPAITVVQTDRGGQITYHGLGQLMVYILLDLRRAKLNVRELVSRIEQAVVNTLKASGVVAYGKCDARGVYVDERKICSIGLRVKKGCSYHGLALNVAMDLTPFSQINPCGYKQLQMVDTSQLCDLTSIPLAKAAILPHLMLQLSGRQSLNRELCQHPALD